MCECNLLIENQIKDPLEIEEDIYYFSIIDKRGKHVLLKGIELKGTIDYSAAFRVKEGFGLKEGYALVFGIKDQ